MLLLVIIVLAVLAICKHLENIEQAVDDASMWERHHYRQTHR
jgi:Tfp pilus assembly protein PilV